MKFKSIWSFLCLLFFAILAIALIGNISSKFDSVYNLIKFKSYVIVSNSMQPTIDPGDVIFIKKSNVNNLEVGDIVTFQKDGFVATHRITEINNDKLITQGDNNNLKEESLNKSNIIGQYMFRVPKIGYFYYFVGSPIGIILLSTIIAILIIYEFCFADNKNNVGKKWYKKAI
ncbi:signal peptidase I [Clostridium sp. D53t1_180928_C8]|uniref:signal peptidase I n=1 Tax=Clostridium sp. D53t1_180928_C8 TaxID=2787101 RepID=UPI0018AA6B9A|nr:signal peptidase I [Clostridium sp. D53t1_180928_C8]